MHMPSRSTTSALLSPVGHACRASLLRKRLMSDFVRRLFLSRYPLLVSFSLKLTPLHDRTHQKRDTPTHPKIFRDPPTCDHLLRIPKSHMGPCCLLRYTFFIFYAHRSRYAHPLVCRSRARRKKKRAGNRRLSPSYLRPYMA